MIVVEVKLVSARGREHDKLLGTTVIANVGTTEDGRHADYDVRVGRKVDAADHGKVYRRPLRTARVYRHPRLAQNVWRLVLKSLAAAFPEQRVMLPDPDSSEQDPEYDNGSS